MEGNAQQLLNLSAIDRQYKVLMLCLPASGHMNPFVCFGRELAKNENVKVILYSTRQYQKLIEGGNIEYRNAEMDFVSNQVTVRELRKNMPVHKLMGTFMKVTESILPELVRCVDEEGIDLIIYDFMTVYAKWLIKYLKIKHQKGELRRPPPKALMFAPSLLREKNVYPNLYEEQLQPKPSLSLQTIVNMLILFAKYSIFCFKYGLPLENPVELIFNTKEEFSICCVVPEFQPRSHLFPPTIRFVGNCAAEEFRKEVELYEPLKSFLEPFPEINPLPLVDLRVPDSALQADSKLIYISLGTVVNREVEPFLVLIDGVKAINESMPQSSNYRYLLSTGDASYASIMSLVKQNKLEIPENLLVQPKVPQLDVLKRASLFITHSGQGSTSEAIHYGVPMVCIPVMGDQPSVAYRVADELGMGIRLDFDTLNPQAIKEATIGVLNNRAYLEKTLLFSQISRKYNGTKEATQLTIEYLQNLTKC